MIPNEAVEAAMRAWGVNGKDQRRIVGSILEAAAPHIAAQAWDDGYSNGREPRHVRINTPNPYRSQSA